MRAGPLPQPFIRAQETLTLTAVLCTYIFPLISVVKQVFLIFFLSFIIVDYGPESWARHNPEDLCPPNKQQQVPANRPVHIFQNPDNSR